MHPLARQSPIKILPVLDIQAGHVVRAVAGNRSQYGPWHSPLCPMADPCQAAQALAAAVGHRELYVADLDALQGRPWQGELLSKLDGEAEMWIDVGIRSADEVVQWTKGLRHAHLILASETSPNMELIRTVASGRTSGRLALSLDLHNGIPRSPGNWLNENNWLPSMMEIWELGIRNFFLIDLATVGTGQGVTVTRWCEKLHRAIPSARIIAGGGVRSLDDLQSLARAGCYAALVATALHGEVGEMFDV